MCHPDGPRNTSLKQRPLARAVSRRRSSTRSGRDSNGSSAGADRARGDFVIGERELRKGAMPARRLLFERDRQPHPVAVHWSPRRRFAIRLPADSSGPLAASPAHGNRLRNRNRNTHQAGAGRRQAGAGAPFSACSTREPEARSARFATPSEPACWRCGTATSLTDGPACRFRSLDRSLACRGAQ